MPRRYDVRDLSNIAGAVGEAVARRLYPTARRHDNAVFDYILPDGQALEAKAAATHGGVHFRGEQGHRLQEVQVVITLYDPRVVAPEHEALLALTRAVALIIAAPGAWVYALAHDYATRHIPAGVLARAAVAAGQSRLLSRLDIAPQLRGRRPRQTRMDYLPLVVVPPDNAHLDLRPDRVRRGYRLEATPF